MINFIDGLRGQRRAPTLPGQTCLFTFYDLWKFPSLMIDDRYFPSGYQLSGNASIPYWATTNRKLISFLST
jgi:hypothetical protein